MYDIKRWKEQWIDREEAQVLLLSLLLIWMTILSLDFSICKMRELDYATVTKYGHKIYCINIISNEQLSLYNYEDHFFIRMFEHLVAIVF